MNEDTMPGVAETPPNPPIADDDSQPRATGTDPQAELPTVGTSSLINDGGDARVRFVPRTLVGEPVRFFTNEKHRQVEKMGEGPYAATVTQVIDEEAAAVHLRVNPPFGQFDTGPVFFSESGEGLERWWQPLSHYD